MNLLVFDVVGKMAHFRNIASNSSSLTYIFPPPTTIYGILACILGIPRNAYYLKLNPQTTFLSVGIMKPYRKLVQTLNYRETFECNNYYTQIPFEVLIPDRHSENLCYRIYVSMQDRDMYSHLRELLETERTLIPVSLGTANFIAKSNYVGEFSVTEIPRERVIGVSSVVNLENSRVLGFEGHVKVVTESMRYSFSAGRSPGRMVTLSYVQCGKIKLKNDNRFFDITIDNNQTIICKL